MCVFSFGDVRLFLKGALRVEVSKVLSGDLNQVYCISGTLHTFWHRLKLTTSKWLGLFSSFQQWFSLEKGPQVDKQKTFFDTYYLALGMLIVFLRGVCSMEWLL